MPYALQYDVPSDEQLYRRVTAEIGDEPKGLGDSVPRMPNQVNGIFPALKTYDSPLDMTALAAAYEVTPTARGDFVHTFVPPARAASSR